MTEEMIVDEIDDPKKDTKELEKRVEDTTPVEETLPEDNDTVKGEEELKQPLEQEDPNIISCYMPTKLNINYLGERVLRLGALCYGISVRGADNKVMVTYNINPDGLHPDHFFECPTTMIPGKVYDMFQRKLSTDIMRMDSMMANLISNKEKLSKMFNHAETGKTTSIAQFDFDVSEYTEEDANADKKLEAMKIQNSTRNLTQGQAKGKARAKAAKVARKKSRRR